MVLLIALVSGGWWLRQRYATATEMTIAIREFSNAEYPEDPADRSAVFGRYHGRKLRLVRHDAIHFDFIVEPTNNDIAKVVFKNIDVSLMTLVRSARRTG